MHIPFWLITALLFPVLLYQGKRARKNTPRLTEAQGSPSGQHGEGALDFRRLVIGESTAASVGVSSHELGLASQLALQLHERTGRHPSDKGYRAIAEVLAGDDWIGS
ncbi:hypothetical protein [Marinobacter sp. NP-4(2019)]|uniref:hypothetical protein n=1 Tax=Marinobacter sp. NP-4(2019) TaxID=2488665 RepID=UPI001D184391|nr:hypothetical protein [Marinobacter sp. NP-4(2019)]